MLFQRNFLSTWCFWLMVAGLSIPPLLAADSTEEWMVLLDGSSLKGWHARDAERPNEWQTGSSIQLSAADPHFFRIEPGKGILANGARGNTTDLLSDAKFGDLEAHIEFAVSKGSNSGVYFNGLYEIQILDSFEKKDLYFGDCGGIYARWLEGRNVGGEAPRLNASKAPGEWQSFDVIFRAPRFDARGRKIENARFVKVLHNGLLVHENFELEGPTRASMDWDEVPLGPLLLQGDHGPVAYRNLRVRPWKEDPSMVSRSPILGLAHIAIQTRDLEKSIRFYTENLGFHLQYRNTLERPVGIVRVALVYRGSCLLELGQQPNPENIKENLEGTVSHFALEVKNIEKVVSDLKVKGIPMEREIFSIPNLFLGIKGAFLKGPSGERIELFEYTH
jgi:catechol 2,3-dioxygenase-like lactoylglutathione lyase family enzyme